MPSAELKIDLPGTAASAALTGRQTKAPSARARPHRATRKKPIAQSCRHCGSPLLDAAAQESGFCCAGCSYVYQLVHDSGLDAYYRIKDQITAPVDPSVFQPQNTDWIEELQHAAEKAADDARDARRSTGAATLAIQGISCAGCVWLIEKLFEQLPGARRINVNAQLGQMELSWQAGEFSLPDFARRLQSFNYLVGPHDAANAAPESRALVRRIGLCTAFVMNTMLFTLPTYFGMEQSFAYARLFGTLSLVFGTLSLLAGGGYFVQRAWAGLRHGLLHIDLPISLGILGAYLGSLYGWATGEERYVYFDFVSTFIVLMLIGRWAQVCAVERNRRRLLALQPRPQHIAVLQADGSTLPTPPEKVQPGQSFELRPGQLLPVEAVLLGPGENSRETAPTTEAAEFSLASINGESAPRAFAAGARIPAGALNLNRRPLRLRATQAWGDSLLAELSAPKAEAAARNPLLERIVQGYLIGILGIAALAAIGWGWSTGDLLKTGAIVTAILVVSCPCAIGLAFPLAEEIASVALRRRGVFVRSARLWSVLHKVRHLVFDKTGTLTLETPSLQNPEALTALAPEARRALYSLVRDNPHPVSQSLLEALLASGPTPGPIVGEVREEIGRGLHLGAWFLGRSEDAYEGKAASPSETRGATLLTHEGRIVARFQLRDSIRSDARDELQRLRELGFTAHILSGDAPAKVATTAAQLGLPAECAHGGMRPQDKAAWLHQHSAGTALMLGDGLNDSLAFDAALARGTPVIHRGHLAQKSDFYYLGRGIAGIRALFEINAARRRCERVILIFSVSYNLIAVGFAVAGLINPLIAAILMPLNSLATLALTGAFSPATTHARGKIPIRGSRARIHATKA